MRFADAPFVVPASMPSEEFSLLNIGKSISSVCILHAVRSFSVVLGYFYKLYEREENISVWDIDIQIFNFYMDTRSIFVVFIGYL